MSKLLVQRTIREWRLDRRFKQDTLAKEIGVTKQTISNWETGRFWPTGAYLQALCSALRIGIEEIQF